MVAIGTWIKARLGITTLSKADQGSFRIGHSYAQSFIVKIAKRDDVGYFYTTAIVEMAFKDGFQFEDKDDKRVDALSDELNDLDWLSGLIRGVGFERRDGSVAFVLFDEGQLVPFNQENTQFKIDKYADFTAFKLTEKIGGYNMPLIHYAGDVDEFEGTSEIELEDIGDLDDVFHEVLREGDIRYEGITVLEPILDILNTRRIIIGSIGIHATRKAAGLRKATIEMRRAGDKEYIKKIEMGLARLEADDMSLILRSGVDSVTGQKWEDKFDILDTDNYDFLSKLEVTHRCLSSATGIPVNYWNGIFQGATIGAPAVLELLRTKFKSVQDSWTKRIEKMAERWCEISGQAYEKDWHLVWNLQPKLTEKEEAEIDQIKATTYATYKNSEIMDTPEIREELGLDPNKEIVVLKEPDISIAVDGLGDKTTKEEPIPVGE